MYIMNKIGFAENAASTFPAKVFTASTVMSVSRDTTTTVPGYQSV